MHRSILTLSLILSFIAPVFAQSFDAKKLELTWEVLDVNYQDKNQIRVALTLTNRDKQVLPAGGWKIYFNYGRSISNVEGAADFKFLNGDLNSLTPKSEFKALAPGQSYPIVYVASGRAINFTDAPSGFYMVWDNDLTKGYALNNPVIKPLKDQNKTGHITTADIYQRNKEIKDIPEEKLVKIFPSPVTYQELAGEFMLHGGVTIASDQLFSKEANLLAEDLKKIFHVKARIISGENKLGIILKKVDGLDKEAYQLEVTPDHIMIKASYPSGVFYGVQSLKTMIPAQAWAFKHKRIGIKAVQATDAPRFPYRAFMVDVARNFQSKEQIFKLLDLMALYKLNVLHFHLNDDEGWRLEIPGLAELTTVSSKRAHTLNSDQHLPASYGSGPDTTNELGTGHYSKNDFIEILKYASQRHIRVIPEVETPGHARAAVKAMDARYRRLMKGGDEAAATQYLLSDAQDSSVYRSVQKWNDNVMNVALPSTYTFIEKVVDEIIEMYQSAGAPLTTIHLGGDEVPNGVWEKSPVVRSFLQNNPQVKNVNDLWYYYFNKANNILKARNLYLSGWEEIALRKTILDGKPRYVPNPDFVNENFHAYVWNNVWGWGSEDLAYRLANAGYKTVLAPVTNFYFDMAYQKDFDESGTYWGSIIDLDIPFSFVPFDYYRSAKDSDGKPVNQSIFAGKERLTEFGQSNIVGLQALIWSETIRSAGQLEYLLTPRLLAFAEKSWAKQPQWELANDSLHQNADYKTSWNNFVNVLAKRELPRLTKYAGGYNFRIPDAGAMVKDGKIVANSQLPGFQIRYTVNGGVPTARSPLYTKPFAAKGIVKLRVFSADGRGGKTVQLQHP